MGTVFFAGSSLVINKCCFIKLCENGDLFRLGTGKFTVQNCYIQSGFTNTNLAIVTINISDALECEFIKVGPSLKKVKRTVCEYEDFFITKLLRLTVLNNIFLSLTKGE
jgi:hypothetical protein